MRLCKIIVLVFICSISCKKVPTKLGTVAWAVDQKNPIRDVHFFDEDNGLAVGGIKGELGFVYATQNGGTTWQKVTQIADGCFYTIDFVNDTLGFIGSDFLLLYKSTDAGKSWQVIPHLDLGVPFHEENRPTIHRLEFSSEGLGAFVGGDHFDTGVFYSTRDGGHSWTFDSMKHEIRALALIDAQRCAIGGFGYQAIARDSLQTLERQPLEGIMITALGFTKDFSFLAGTVNGKILKSDDNGQSWREVYVPGGGSSLKQSLNALAFDRGIGYAVGNYGHAMRSADGGESWQPIDLGTSADLLNLKVYQNRIMVPTDEGIVLVLNN